jgi:hypothetical protein
MKATRATRHLVPHPMRREAQVLLEDIQPVSRQLNSADLYPRGHVYLDKVLLGMEHNVAKYN